MRCGTGTWTRLSLVALVAGTATGLSACSSVAFPEGAGGSLGTGGASPGAGGGTGGSFLPEGPSTDNSCDRTHINPDFAPGGACAADCQSVSCGRPCSEDCCVTCGIDQTGSKICTCPTPGAPYANCTCSPPPTIPAGLSGGSCSPQGLSTTLIPVDSGAISLRGMPCRTSNIVCFTSDSTAAAERGCICQDGTMHCGSVNHWFTNNGTETFWQL